MELKLQVAVFISLIHVSLAVWQRVTVMKGQTVNLKCPVRNGLKTNVEWRNPEGYIMFFNNLTGISDKRYSIKKQSESEFIVSISNVAFKDGGIYTCSHYGHHTTDKEVEVTVLSGPKMSKAVHEGRFVITCTAEGNRSPPQISWKLDQGPEIHPHSVQITHEDKKFVSTDMLHVHSVENRVTVKCIVRHPALHSQTLMKYIKIGQYSSKPRRPTPTQPQGSTEIHRTTTGGFGHEITTKDMNGPSSTLSAEPKTATAPTPPPSYVTSKGSHLSTSGSSRKGNDTTSNATGTTGWTSVSETTEGSTSLNRTEGNTTGNFNVRDMHTGTGGSSSLLVFLVTLLISCLLVVVIFFAIKLRRAHIAWKRENEDDPSEDSSKSKSSQEEKNAQDQRRRGLVNTAFTQYVVEEAPAMTSVINTAAVAAPESVNPEHTSQPQTWGQTPVKSVIKETEL